MFLNCFQIFIGVYVTLVFYQIDKVVSASKCDRIADPNIQRGNIGQTKMFTWLGVLRVFLDKFTEDHVAVTTIILIRDRFALGSASDIGKIPKSVLEQDSLAVFLIEDEQTWDCEVKNAYTHPEYSRNNYTLALVELSVVTRKFPILPVCVAMRLKDTLQHLYAVGTTHGNEVLEKVFYKMTHVSKIECNNFYNKVEIKRKWGRLTPASNFTCAYSANSESCNWENGMVLIANVTGWFNLIGFGIKGPGCSSPSRFLDVKFYLPWMRYIMGANAYPSKPQRFDDIESVPAHHMFTKEHEKENSAMSSRRRLSETKVGDVQQLSQHVIRTAETSDNETVFIVHRFNHTWELYKYACRTRTSLIFHELTATFNALQKATLTYELNLYNKLHPYFLCLRLGVQATYRTEAILTFTEVYNFIDDIRVGVDDDSFIPRELFERHRTPHQNVWRQESNISNIRNTRNYDIYLQLVYLGFAALEFEIYGHHGWTKEDVDYAATG